MKSIYFDLRKHGAGGMSIVDSPWKEIISHFKSDRPTWAAVKGTGVGEVAWVESTVIGELDRELETGFILHRGV